RQPIHRCDRLSGDNRHKKTSHLHGTSESNMSQFANKWEKSNTAGISSRVRDSVKNPGPLKPRLDMAVRQIQVQVAKLDSTSAKLRERDASIFNKIVSSIQKHDSQHASV